MEVGRAQQGCADLAVSACCPRGRDPTVGSVGTRFAPKKPGPTGGTTIYACDVCRVLKCFSDPARLYTTAPDSVAASYSVAELTSNRPDGRRPRQSALPFSLRCFSKTLYRPLCEPTPST